MRVALLILAALLVGIVLAPGMLLSLFISDSDADAALISSSCQVSTSGGTQVAMDRLTAAQVATAHTIWAVAHQVGMGDRAAIVGIATAMQESTMGANPATKRPNSDVDVGTFQQRALVGWYADGLSVEENVAILNDDATGARTFFLGHTVTAKAHAAASSPAGPVGYHIPGLTNIRGWETMEVTRAAQAVQRSAHPTLYAQHEPLATQLVAAFRDEGAPAGEVLCDPIGAVDAANCPATGLDAEAGLTPDGLRVLRCAFQQWPGLTYGGVRPDSMSDHPSGRAIDIMTLGSCDPVGDTIAQWARQNAASLGVDYIIWCQKIWSTQRDSEGWRAMTDRGSASANHTDHVHVTVRGNSAGTTTATGPVVSPVDSYTLTARHNQAGRYWSSGFHTGLDFAANGGPPIRAVKAGTVISSNWNSAYGNIVKIDHGDVQSWYAHLSRSQVKAGQRVAAGEEIGRMGETGNVTGEHLHLEIRRGGSPIDPDAWLAANGVRLNGSRAGSLTSPAA